MRSVHVNFLRAGQVVADAVKSPGGAVLCPIGFQLTDTAIQRLKNANVSMIWIEGNSAPPVDIAARLAALDERFAGIEDPTLLEIKSLVAARYNRIKEEYGM